MTETTALEKRPPKQEAPALSNEKRTLIRDQWFKGASELEFQMGIAICEALRLDPIRKQIHFVKIWDSNLRREVMQPIVGIEGIRALAEETGMYRGQTDTEWCGADGEWKNVWLAEEPPAAARVGIKREGFPDPVYAVARFRSYCRTNKGGGLNATWQKMDDVMIAKCAEALAFRKTFGGRLAGAYADEEMDHMRVVDGGDLNDVAETKTLPEGKSSFGFKRRKEKDTASKQNLAELVNAIDQAETDDDLMKCTVNGDLTDADRAYAKRRWQSRREVIHQKQRQQKQDSADEKEQPPKQSTVDEGVKEPVETPSEPEPDPWIKHMDQTREQAANGGQQKVDKDKQDNGKKSPNDKR